MKDPCNQVFLAIANAMSEIEADPIQMYWLSTRFYKVQSKYKVVIPLMVRNNYQYIIKKYIAIIYLNHGPAGRHLFGHFDQGIYSVAFHLG